MKKILIKIKKNNLIFKERTKLSNESKNLLNTNVISDNELLFSDEYIIENKKIVSSFIIELCKSYNLDTAIIESSSLYDLIVNLFTNNILITSLVLKDEVSLTYSLCEKIVKTSIKNVSCYNLQPFMLEMLDKNHVLVESHNEILFLSSFMTDNNLNIYSSLFYKMTLNMEFPLSDQDAEDFVTFCKINKYLKVIHVNMASLKDLEFIVQSLKSNNKRNIKIIIHDNIADINLLEYLRDFNKKKSKKYKISFKLNYSDDYIEQNIIKEANSNMLKFCGLLILLVIVATFGYVFYDNYASMQNVKEIKENITKVIQITDTANIIADKELNKEEEHQVINEDLVALLNINPETVAWLKVNNTNIDYPVVQTVNNSAYLNHNFYMEKDSNGWVFMDFRNEFKEREDNLIIYAHNRYYSGVMFGTLQNTLRYSWYTKPENRVISFRTMYENREYQIFSIYKIQTTTDYLRTVFTGDEDRLEFFTMLRARSIYDFEVEINGDDKILTLSTCADDHNRYVVHAVLIK